MFDGYFNAFVVYVVLLIVVFVLAFVRNRGRELINCDKCGAFNLFDGLVDDHGCHNCGYDLRGEP